MALAEGAANLMQRLSPFQRRHMSVLPSAESLSADPAEVEDPKLEIVQKEVFGPVLTVQRFDDELEAIRLANDSEIARYL